MKKEVFKHLIVDFQNREMSNIYPRDVKIPLNSKKIISLIGVRRSGKTSIMYLLIQQLRSQYPTENIVYINFEDDRLFPLELKDLNLFLDAFFELYPTKKKERVFFFFDEIQNIPHWEKFVRRIYDSENCSLFITGSSSKLLAKEIATALRGRTISYEIYPLSFHEFLRFKNIEIQVYSSKSKSAIHHALQEYIFKGGFPELVGIEKIQAIQILQEYIELIMYKDIAERFSISNILLLKRIIQFCFANIANHFSVNKLFHDFHSDGFNCSKNTIHEYIKYLEDAFAVFTIPLYSSSIRQQWRNTKKLYSIDVGFKPAVTYMLSPDTGRVIENIVFLELKRKTQNIYYIKNDTEVDFYYEIDGQPILLNVCFDLESKTTRKREVDGLSMAMKTLKLKESTIVSLNDSETIKTDNGKVHIVHLADWLLKKM